MPSLPLPPISTKPRLITGISGAVQTPPAAPPPPSRPSIGARKKTSSGRSPFPVTVAPRPSFGVTKFLYLQPSIQKKSTHHSQNRKTNPSVSLALHTRILNTCLSLCVWIERPVKHSGNRLQPNSFLMKAHMEITTLLRVHPPLMENGSTAGSAQADSFATISMGKNCGNAL